MRPIRIALLALFALSAAPAAHAQPPAPTTEAAASPVTGAPAPATAAPSSGTSGLPRSAPPRTLRAYAHVFAAFTIVWLLLFGYVVSLSRRFRRVEEQVEALARA